MADGTRVHLWNDGTITQAFGFRVRGSSPTRTAEGREVALRAGWLVMGECEFFDRDDLADLLAAAKWAAKRNGLPGDMRTRFWSERRRARVSRPSWRVTTTDSTGKAVERWWVLPRLGRLAGLAVFDRGCSPRRFSVHTRIAKSGGGDETFAPTGFTFETVRDVIDHLADTLDAQERAQ